MKLCIKCGKNPATLPDRERMGRPIKCICQECHSKRLKADMYLIKTLAQGEKSWGDDRYGY